MQKLQNPRIEWWLQNCTIQFRVTMSHELCHFFLWKKNREIEKNYRDFLKFFFLKIFWHYSCYIVILIQFRCVEWHPRILSNAFEATMFEFLKRVKCCKHAISALDTYDHNHLGVRDKGFFVRRAICWTFRTLKNIFRNWVTKFAEFYEDWLGGV